MSAAAAATAAADALDITILPGGTVEPGDKSVLQRMSKFLELACWQFLHHAVHMQLGCHHGTTCERRSHLQRGLSVHAHNIHSKRRD